MYVCSYCGRVHLPKDELIGGGLMFEKGSQSVLDECYSKSSDGFVRRQKQGVSVGLQIDKYVQVYSMFEKGCSSPLDV